MTRGHPCEGHPADLALKNDNSIAKVACHFPSDIFGGLGFPVQVKARVRVLSLSMRFANAKRRFLTQPDEKTNATFAKKLKTPRKTHDSRRPCINHNFIFATQAFKSSSCRSLPWGKGHFGSPAEDCLDHVLLSPKCAN